ncbi:predicted protein [Naegleria gruberi]|uniref:Predicted protein n=1 Tax=Naegleria gruberi TaxID=5762 RepID=D2VGY3_NAEGR|nr:uncharacterized protein NAEGRDRAFT_79951 [Naegleria gruberi]EFC43885.1 predicted protein [Naegleria gruberi]|eukprot:XP_002676629.1 predicted protein [Naegleria gruberi strain NEG-M]
MRLFIRLLGANIADSLKFDDVENSTSIADIKRLVHQHTNLTPTDKVICYFNNVELTSNEISLWDLSVKNNQTITMVIERDAGEEKFKVSKPKDLGVFTPITESGSNDHVLANIFSFLSARDIALSIELTCRRFRISTIVHHEVVWEALLNQLYARHDASTHGANSATYALNQQASNSGANNEEDQPTTASEKVLFKSRGIDCRKLYKQTIVIEKVWEHIKQLTPNQNKQVASLESEKELVSKLSNVRQIKVRRKPKELTEDDEQFLKANDLKKLKLDVRSRGKKTKEEREADLERYSRFKKLQKRKEEMEQGAWQVVPENLLMLSYEELMKHSFSFDTDSVYGFYNDRGQYFIVQKEGKKLLYVGELEVVGDKFKIAHILSDGANPKANLEIAKEFFQYLGLCSTKHIEEKKLVNIVVNPQGVKGLFVDAILDVLITLRKFEGLQSAERPRIEVKEPEKSTEKKLQQANQGKGALQHSVSTVELTEEEKADPEFDRYLFNATAVAYKEEEGIDASLDSLVETYVSALIQALKQDTVGSLGLPLCEELFFKKLKKDDEVSSSKLGVAFGKALTKYLAETEKTRQQAASSAPTEDEEVSVEENLKSLNNQKKKKKKVFRKIVLAVESEQVKQQVISNLATLYEH